MAANDRSVKVSRRRFLVGAGATAAVLTAGGATAGVVLHERKSGTAAKSAITLDGQPTSDAGPNPLDDPDTRLRHLLRRTSFVALPADVARYRDTPIDKVLDDLLSQDAIDDSAIEATIAGSNFDAQKQSDVIGTWTARLMHTQRPVVERMTLFWHGLLTSGLAKTGKDPGALLTQNEFSIAGLVG